MKNELAIGYGRKSFDDPDRRTSSVDDQHEAAKGYAFRHGLELVAFHGDNGITGATMERPGLQRMLAAITAGAAKVVIIEDVDRLGRDQEHLQHMIKIFRLHGVVLHTVAAGKIDDLVFAFKGIIGEQQRMRIAYTTRRGLKGKAKRGGATGGRTLGYRREVLAQTTDGKDVDRLVVVPEQADLIRRIFTLYAEGNSLKEVCSILNRECVPSPRARETGPYSAGIWNPTTLSGDPGLGEGILNNEAYIGRVIFNRRTWIEVPNENRGFSRRPRVNPESEWIVRDEPEMRIVDQRLWETVKSRQAIGLAARDARFGLTGRKLAGGREASHLLSGLVECGKCGRPFLASGGGRWRCKGSRAELCDNGSITSTELEGRALAGLRERLLTPERIGRFAELLQEELKAARQDSLGNRTALVEKLASVRSRIVRIVTQIEGDDEAPRSLGKRLVELEGEEQTLAEELAAAGEAPVVRLPVNYAASYQRAVDEIGAHLATGEGTKARTALRKLIARIVVCEGSARGGRRRPMQLHGDLFEMLEFAKQAVRSETQTTRRVSDGPIVTGLVAGIGFEPMTFRL